MNIVRVNQTPDDDPKNTNWINKLKKKLKKEDKENKSRKLKKKA